MNDMRLDTTRSLPWWILGAAWLLCLLPISGESLWFDEGTTSFLAMQGTFTELWQELTATTFSESQMPGYIVYMWSWVKVFGSSEWALRMSNFPFMVLLTWVVARLPLRTEQRIMAIGLIVLSPFLWYNLDEARSTIAVLGWGGMALGGVIHYFDGPETSQRAGLWMTALACAGGFAFNMLFYFMMLPLLAYAVLRAIGEKRPLVRILRDAWPMLLAMVLIGGGMLVYYVGTLLRGAGGVKEMPGVANVGFVLYEFLGFNGLGPAREAMKADLSAGLIMGRLPYMIPMLLAAGGMFVLTLRYQATSRTLTNPLLVSLLVGLAGFFAIAYVVKFQFWGRHAVYLFPFFVLYVTEVWVGLMDKNRRWVQGVIGLWLLCWVVSSLTIRWDADYQKRGAREAVEQALVAAQAEDLPIAWTTNWMVGYYYGLQFAQDYSFTYPAPKTEDVWQGVDVPPFEASLLADVLDRRPQIILIWFNAFSSYDKLGDMKRYVQQRPHEVLSKTPHYQLIRLK